MSSIIHYKFKASKSWDPLLFEGTSLSVAEAKRQITATKKLHKQSADSDIILSNEQTGEDYEDSAHIPKNSRIVVRRVPVTKSRTIKYEQAPEAEPTAEQTANPPIIQPVNQPINPPNNAPLNAPVATPINQPVNNQPQPVNQPVSQPISQPSNQATNVAAEFRCQICHQFYSNAQIVPCCFASFCDECIRQTLLSDNSLTCPACQSKPVDIEQLQPNVQLQKAVDEFLARKQAAARPPQTMHQPFNQPMNQQPFNQPINPVMQNPNQMPPYAQQGRFPNQQYPQNAPQHRPMMNQPPFGGPMNGPMNGPMMNRPMNGPNGPMNRPGPMNGPMNGQMNNMMMQPNRMPPQQFPHQPNPNMQQMPQQQHPNVPPQQQHAGHLQHPSRQFVQPPPNSGFTSQYLNGHPSNGQERQGSPMHQGSSNLQDRNQDRGNMQGDRSPHRGPEGEQGRNNQEESSRSGQRFADVNQRVDVKPAEKPRPATFDVDEPQTLHTVVSYHMLPCGWNGASRSVALVVLDNGVRALAGASLLPNSSFKLGPQYLGLRPNAHLLLARYVPPTHSNSHLLLNRAGLEQWLDWQAEGRATSLPMPNDFRAVAVDCVLPWMNENIELPLVPSQAPNTAPGSSTGASPSVDPIHPPAAVSSGPRKVVVRGARSGAHARSPDSDEQENDRRRSREVFEQTNDDGNTQPQGTKRSVKRRRLSHSPDDKRSYSHDEPRDTRRDESPDRGGSRGQNRNRKRKDKKRDAKQKDKGDIKGGEERQGGRHNVRLRDR